jgi:hypothetical protein
MSLEAVPIVLTLTFFGLCGLVSGVLVQGRREEPPRNTQTRS